MGSLSQEGDVVVIGGGPGGYVAAIRAADLGKEVTLIEERNRLGGTCLLEGCIPSKTLIHAVELADSVRRADEIGFSFDGFSLDENALRKWTDSVVANLSKGVDGLLDRRGIEVIHGRARFESNRKLTIEGADVSAIEFKHCIIATGSSINTIPEAFDVPVWSSAEALKIPEIPERLLVVGGGYIGLEMGLVYAGLGSRVSMVEFFPRLLMGADPDLVNVVVKNCKSRFEQILVDSKVTGIEKRAAGFSVAIEHEGETDTQDFTHVLVAVGRKPNTADLGLENTKIVVNEQGVIDVNDEMRTAEKNIFAIGDVAPGPMLAHKASREGKVAAEVIAGRPSAFDNRAVPAVIFTDPEISWAGLTETEAKEKGIAIKVGRFPLRALGRAWTLGRTEGFVKILCDPENEQVLGVGMVGPLASELISEGALAIEMGATLEDLMVTIHPHPTLSEAIQEAAEVAAGSATHIDPRKK